MNIATSDFDIYYIPEGLKIKGKSMNDKDAYITELGVLMNQVINPDPFDEKDIDLNKIGEQFGVNLEIWTKKLLNSKYKNQFVYTMKHTSMRFEKTLKFHSNN